MIIFQEFLFTFGWAIVGGLSMAIGLAIVTKVFNKLTPLNEWEQIKEGNMAMGVVLAAVILSAAIVIGNAI